MNAQIAIGQTSFSNIAGRGWMYCDEKVINQENYDAIHGPGSYLMDQVASSPIAGKRLPKSKNISPFQGLKEICRVCFLPKNNSH